MATTREDLTRAVRSRATGYRVEETSDGFAIERDLDVPDWWEEMRRTQVRMLLRHEVHVDEADGSLAITDVERSVEWGQGTPPRPRWGASLSVTKGRVSGKRVSKTYGRRPDGSFGILSDQSVDLSEGREIVRAVASEQGWDERMPTSMKVGVVFATIGAGGAVVTLVVLGVIALLGGFS